MSIYIDVPHAYFEMARAIFNVLNVEMKKWEEGSQVLNDEQKKNIQLSSETDAQDLVKHCGKNLVSLKKI